jgi:anaerobic magnesium-protoporphyrin IX monomethyl ester cyclase
LAYEIIKQMLIAQRRLQLSDKLDLLLVYPPWPILKKRGILQNNLPPLGILSIASHCREQEFSVEVLDVHAGRLGEEDVLNFVKEKQPRCVGISVLTNMSIPAHYIAKLCKKAAPNCVIIAGGVHAESMPEAMLSNSAIDAVGRGDGEDLMLEILQGKSFSDIRGLSYREGLKVVNNIARDVNKNLDDYPMPAYDLIDFKNYFPAVGSYRRYPAINMLMTRGCPGKCIFCNSAFTTLRSRSARSMVDQIKHLRYKYGIRQIQFYDDTFTVAKKRVIEFCQYLIDEKVDITWTAYIRGDCFSEDIAKIMKKAGCHQVLVGIESGDAKVLEIIRKPINKDRYKKAIDIAHKYGMEVRGSFIIGCLGETKESMQATLDFAKTLDIDIFQLSILTPYPGTQIYKHAVENNLLLHKDWAEYGQGSVIMDSPILSADEIYEFEKHAFRSFYLSVKQVIRQLKRVTSFRQIKDLFLGFYTMILGDILYKNPKWNCWLDLKEEDMLDLQIEQPEKLQLTYQLRQIKVESEKTDEVAV